MENTEKTSENTEKIDKRSIEHQNDAWYKAKLQKIEKIRNKRIEKDQKEQQEEAELKKEQEKNS